jgi:signal transduction histidine kinase
VIALSAVLIIAYGVSTGISLRRSHQQTLRDAAATLESTARSAEVGTSRALFEIDAILSGVDRMLSTVLSGMRWDAPAVKTLLCQFDHQSLAVSDILILDDKGREMNRAGASSDRAVDYGEIPFFKAHQTVASPGLFIAPPEQSAVDGVWLITVSRPLLRNGAVRGVVAARVPIATFAGFYDAIVTNGAARISLFLDNGVLVASEPDQQEAIGRVTGSARAVLAAAATKTAGLLDVPGRKDGDPVVLSFRRVPEYPLLVTVARGRADILQQWYEELTASVVAFLLFTCAAVTFVSLVVRALRRRQLAAADLRRSEGRLKRQSSLLQSTLENIGEGLSVFDSRGRLIAWNSRFCELLELPLELDVGTPLRDVLMLQAIRGDFGDEEPETEVAKRLERFYRDVPAVKERVTPGGRTLQIRRHAMPDGAVVSVYSDVTEIKTSERKLVYARSQAEMANRSKSDFLANMSHELRTPLNAIIGFSEIISNELFGPIKNKKYLEYMKDIHNSSLHLLSIINDVLDMSKIEAGKLELSKEVLNIQRVISAVMRMMHERAASRDIKLVAELLDVAVDIWADERAMKQIFLNLLSNAIKFSQNGGSVIVRVLAEGPNLAVLEFEDYGIGMTEEEQERALQPFGQAKPATTRNYGGTGLGLPITKGLVEAHGGKLIVQSRAGHGTTVRVVLPTERMALRSDA